MSYSSVLDTVYFGVSLLKFSDEEKKKILK